MTHKQLREEQLEAIRGYLKSIQNLSICASLLITQRRYDLLFTVLKDIEEAVQSLMDCSTTEDKSQPMTLMEYVMGED